MPVPDTLEDVELVLDAPLSLGRHVGLGNDLDGHSFPRRQVLGEVHLATRPLS